MTQQKPTVTEPGSQAGGERRRLEHAPGERYGPAGTGGARGRGAGGGPGGGSGGAATRRRMTRSIVAAVLVADAAAVLFFVVGLLDVAGGLLVVAAFAGWIVALALVWGGRDVIPAARLRVALAAFLGGWAVAGGILLDWLYAVVVQLGVLGPLEYVVERYGIVAPVSLLLAAGVAALRAR